MVLVDAGGSRKNGHKAPLPKMGLVEPLVGVEA